MNSSGWSASALRHIAAVLAVAVACVVLVGCGGGGEDSDAGGSAATETTAANSDRGTKQEPKQQPAEGTGNVQGTVFYNDEPVAGIKVTLCETFSRFIGGCSGEQYEATTEADGVYVVADVAPGDYEGLLVSVFDTDQVQFATSGIVSAKAYTVEEGETLFVDPTHLYRADLRVTSPAAGSQVAAEGLSVAWDAYPDAAYYELTLHSEDPSEPSPIVGQRVDGTSYEPPEPLAAGSYRVSVAAFNAKARKLAENDSGYVFAVTG